MSRGLLMLLLALDLLVMGGAGFIVWDRIKKKTDQPAEITAPAPQIIQAPAASAATETGAVTAANSSPSTGAPPADMGSEPIVQTQTSSPVTAADLAKPAPKGPPRKILFRYNDVAAKRVSIVGDFNQWSPKLMKKDAYGHWLLALSIPPGDYAYNFIVDGRMIRDPNNKRVKQSSQAIPSSLLSVGSGKKR